MSLEPSFFIAKVSVIKILVGSVRISRDSMHLLSTISGNGIVCRATSPSLHNNGSSYLLTVSIVFSRD